MPANAPPPVAVLLADPDAGTRAAIAAGLAAAGYQVDAVPVDAALRGRLGQSWDALILDISAADFLPDAAAAGVQPILILLAQTLRPEDAIAALQNLGADACLEKPVHVGVLVATLASLRRRLAHMTEAFVARRAAPRGGEENNVWKLSPTQWTITCPRGRTAKLTLTETAFLHQLAREPGATVPRDDLIVAMGRDPDIYDRRRLDTFVSRLRGKVADACENSPPLRSVHALGYSFAAPLVLID